MQREITIAYIDVDQGMLVGPAFQSKGCNGEVPAIKRAKESFGSFYSYRADVNFQIAVALACLHDKG